MTILCQACDLYASQIRKAIHKYFGMLDTIIGDSVVAVWGLHVSDEDIVESIFSAAQEMVAIARQTAEEWQSHIDLLVEPKGLRLGLSKGPIVVIRRDAVYPGCRFWETRSIWRRVCKRPPSPTSWSAQTWFIRTSKRPG